MDCKMEKNIMLDRQTNKKMAALFKLCLRINGNEKRYQELSGDLPTVFFDLLGNTAHISIRVFCGGWVPNGDPDIAFNIHADERFNEEEFTVAYNYLLNLAVETSVKLKKKVTCGR